MRELDRWMAFGLCVAASLAASAMHQYGFAMLILAYAVTENRKWPTRGSRDGE